MDPPNESVPIVADDAHAVAYPFRRRPHSPRETRPIPVEGYMVVLTPKLVARAVWHRPARDQIFESTASLRESEVLYVARFERSTPIEDLRQAAALGVLEAIRRGSTEYLRWIRHELYACRRESRGERPWSRPDARPWQAEARRELRDAGYPEDWIAGVLDELVPPT